MKEGTARRHREGVTRGREKERERRDRERRKEGRRGTGHSRGGAWMQVIHLYLCFILLEIGKKEKRASAQIQQRSVFCV